MDWVVWVLFEKPLALLAALFTVNFVLLVYWRHTGRMRPLLVGLAVAVVLLAVQALVVTRREHALRLLRGIEKDVVAARTESLAAALAPGFQAGGMDRHEFMAYVRRQYNQVRVRSVNCSELRVVESLPDEFLVEAAYQGDVIAEEQSYAGWVRTRWEIRFVHTEAGWRILTIRPTYIDGIDHPSWEDIDRR